MRSQMFQTRVPKAASTNAAGGIAYELDPRNALAQIAVTGCFGNTFYASGEAQLDNVLKYARQCEPHYVAKVAVYARKTGYMKDMPAVLLAYLASLKTPEGNEALALAFSQVCDNGRMIRNFVQAIRSGVFGRKSLGTLPKRLVRTWLAQRKPMQLLRDSVGNKPSLADVIKIVHPQPETPEQAQTYGYLLGKGPAPEALQGYERWKAGEGTQDDLKGVPTSMLTGFSLKADDWAHIARRAKWQETRMNLNTFQRQGVFQISGMIEEIATKIASEENVRGAKAFPYQLLTAYLNVGSDVPWQVKDALQTAMEHAIQNVPALEGNVAVCVDVSGSMSAPVTGHQTKTTCKQIAALIAACVLRKNPGAVLLPFGDRLFVGTPNPRDSVMTLAQGLASLSGGGTNCSLPLQYLVQSKAKVDSVIFVSDNESWLGNQNRYWGTDATGAWLELRKTNPQARMVCIDLTPNPHAQVPNCPEVLNVGGFTDSVFGIVDRFLNGEERDFAKIIDNAPL